MLAGRKQSTYDTYEQGWMCGAELSSHTSSYHTGSAAQSAGKLSQPRKVKVWADESWRETRGWKHGPGHCLERERERER